MSGIEAATFFLFLLAILLTLALASHRMPRPW